MRLFRTQRGNQQKYSVTNNQTGKLVEDDGIGEKNEHFVLMLKDQYSRAALMAYAEAAQKDGETEYAKDVMELADRAGPCSPFVKKPD